MVWNREYLLKHCLAYTPWQATLYDDLFGQLSAASYVAYYKHDWLQYSVPDPYPPALMYSFEALWCKYYDYRHSISWGEPREYCAGISGRMGRDKNNVMFWNGMIRVRLFDSD